MKHNVICEQFSERKAGEHSEKTRQSDTGTRTGTCCPILIKIIFEKFNEISIDIKFYTNYFSDHEIVKLRLMETAKSVDEFIPEE